MRIVFLIFLSALSISLLGAATARAALWRVPDDAPTIQAGIDSAKAGDTVEVACGTYYEHSIVMKSGVVLTSESGLFDCVTIDGQGEGRVIYCHGLDQDTQVVGLTITGGSFYDGAGMYCTVDTRIDIKHCRFTGNIGTWATGLACVLNSSPTVSHCIFDDNLAERDGAGIGLSNSEPLIENCTFYGNHCDETGPAVYGQNGAVMMLDHCLMAYNTSDSFGWEISPPIYCRDASVSMTACLLYTGEEDEWIGCHVYLQGTAANFTAEPGFCDAEAGDFHLCADSYCLPGILPNGQQHGLIGALDQGCDACGPHVPSEARSWGAVKDMYR